MAEELFGKQQKLISAAPELDILFLLLYTLKGISERKPDMPLLHDKIYTDTVLAFR